jgi:hypothetical protein
MRKNEKDNDNRLRPWTLRDTFLTTVGVAIGISLLWLALH